MSGAVVAACKRHPVGKGPAERRPAAGAHRGRSHPSDIAPDYERSPVRAFRPSKPFGCRPRMVYTG